jgi:hypothetical protein
VDPPLGVARRFRPHSTHIGSNATLILYTDGLIERRGETITTGVERLRKACADGPTDGEALSDHLIDVMLHDSRNRDDVALLIVSTDVEVLRPVSRARFASALRRGR